MGIKILDKINAEQTAKLAEKQFPEFKAGDIVRVSIRVREGDKTRVQDFEGKVLAVDNGRKNASGNFTVSRDSYGVRVEKLFPFNSPASRRCARCRAWNARRRSSSPRGSSRSPGC